MKRLFTALLLALPTCAVLLQTGCPRLPKTPEKQVATAKPPEVDEAEILIHHILQRNASLGEQLSALQNDMIRASIKCLDEEIAMLEDRPIVLPKRDPVAAHDALAKSMADSMEILVQYLLDSEAYEAVHNRNHPESPFLGPVDSLRRLCGDCTAARARRKRQLDEEASGALPVKEAVTERPKR